MNAAAQPQSGGPSPPVFVTGGTGYLGRPLLTELIARGITVAALVRPGSARKLPQGAISITGDALDPATFAAAVPPQATFVHLVGTPHPNPSKAAEFQRVDLASVRAATEAARQAAVRHFVYVSVAHPAPVMKAFIAVRQEGERLIAATGIPATIIRPWYVLGPGHYWPYALVPVYALLRAIPATHDTAVRLGLVTCADMVRSLVEAAAGPPPAGTKIIGVPDIRRP